MRPRYLSSFEKSEKGIIQVKEYLLSIPCSDLILAQEYLYLIDLNPEENELESTWETLKAIFSRLLMIEMGIWRRTCLDSVK